MKRNRIAVVVLAGLLAAGCANEQDRDADISSGDGTSNVPGAQLATSSASVDGITAADGITVVGSGVASGKPDVVRVTVGVEVERDQVQRALDDANTVTEDVLRVLGEQGVAQPDLQTRDFSVYPVHRDDGNGDVRIDGYAVRNLVEATVRDVDTVGAVIQAAAETAGDETRIHGVWFDLEDDGEQMTAAREAALADARDKAEQYARLSGGELGEPVAIEERTASTPRRAMTEGAADMASSGASVPIEAGEHDVTVHVTVRWSTR